MPPAPLVSVVVPFLEPGPAFAEAVGSVFAQTFRRWELLLVDDGGADGSAAFARACARRRPDRVRALRVAGGRRGAFAARLRGVRAARADVIALLDADDVWEPRYLERHLAYWRGLRGVDWSYGPARFWFPGTPDGSRDFSQSMPARGRATYAPGELLRNFLSSGYATAPCTSCSLVRRGVFEAAAFHGGAARRAPIYEDQFLIWAAAARGRFAVHPGAWVRYRQVHAPRAWAAGRAVRAQEAGFLTAVRRDLERTLPGHALLRPEGIPARLRALRAGGGDYFYRRIPAALRAAAGAAEPGAPFAGLPVLAYSAE